MPLATFLLDVPICLNVMCSHCILHTYDLHSGIPVPRKVTFVGLSCFFSQHAKKLLCFSLNFFSVFFFLHVGDNNVNKVKSRELTERFRCVSVDRNQREFLDSWGIWDPFFFLHIWIYRMFIKVWKKFPEISLIYWTTC